MNKQSDYITSKSDSLWIAIIVASLLTLLIPYLIWIMIKNDEWAGSIVLVPMLILLVILIRGLIKLKEIRIKKDKIEVRNFWNKNLEDEIILMDITKMIYDVPGKVGPPMGPLKIIAIAKNKEHRFSIKGYYVEDFVKLFKKYNFPIYKQMGDRKLKSIKKEN